MATGIIHPKLLPMLVKAGYFPRKVKIVQLIDANELDGQESHTEDPVPVYDNLDGRLIPIIQVRPQNQESRSATFMRENNDNQLALAGKYNGITDKMRAYVDGVRYEIKSVEGDGQDMYTRLIVCIETPHSYV